MCHWYLVVNLGYFTKCFCEHSCTYIFSDYLLCFLRVHRVESLDNLKAINLLLYKTSISSPRKYTFIILFFNISESLIHSSISEKFMHITHHHSTIFLQWGPKRPPIQTPPPANLVLGPNLKFYCPWPSSANLTKIILYPSFFYPLILFTCDK